MAAQRGPGGSQDRTFLYLAAEWCLLLYSSLLLLVSLFLKDSFFCNFPWLPREGLAEVRTGRFFIWQPGVWCLLYSLAMVIFLS